MKLSSLSYGVTIVSIFGRMNRVLKSSSVFF